MPKPDNNRKAYILHRKKDESEYEQTYELIPFLDLKKGDIFVLTEPEGNPVPNLDSSVTSVALRDAYTDNMGVWGILCESIVAHYADKDEEK